MREKELIKTIKSVLNSEYIGDDCAYLSDLGITYSQDSLVEDVHFSMKFTDAYMLGYKTAMVNISDICASGAKPLYMTISLSLPCNIGKEFVKSFYEGVKSACGDVKVVGGDITGSGKIYISASIIGSAKGRRISSRSNAKAGYKVIVSGEHGSSAKGLELLLSGKTELDKFTKAHLMPQARVDFSEMIAKLAREDYAMTDSSDGLADACMQIAKASGVTISIDTSKIPHDASVDIQTVLYGGEDYELVAVVPEGLLKNISGYTIIGDVIRGESGLMIDNVFFSDIDDKIINHFKEENER